ncbi:MAG: MFS transporter [Ancrocorticia sp.]|uniref:MFS transporter n=1 Tax=Ancrocorticia sp. TaxID=2593684 RepID=UPI003F916BC7
MRSALADTRPLAHPDFARLWYANIITVIGAQLTVVTVPAQLWAISRDSMYVGLTGLFGLVPLIIFGLWGGAIADSFDRRKVLLVSTIGLIATTTAFAIQALMSFHNVWLILSIFSVQQAFFALNQPARNAIIPMIMPTSELPAANALNMTVFNFGAIAGPLVGGALLPILGAGPLYSIDAVTMLATLWAVIKLPPMRPKGTDTTTTKQATSQGKPANGRAKQTRKKAPGLRSVIDGFRYTWIHKILLMSFVVDLIAMIFGMPRALYPEIANINFGGPASGGMEFALLSAGMAAGAVVGGIFSGWVSRVRRQGRAVLIAVAVWGFAIVGLGVAVSFAGGHAMPFLALGVFMLAIGGAADMASAAFRQSILQSAATDEVRGRLQGVFIVVVAGGPRLADMLHGFVAGHLGAAWTVLGGGVLVVLGVTLCYFLVPKFSQFRV